MMNHRCYEHVDKFSQLFDRLLLCGGEPSPAHVCIAAVCSAKKTQAKLNLQKVNFQVRCVFESSELMKDYIESTCWLQFEKAASGDPAERLDILKKLKANPGIPTALSADVSMALTVFDDSLSLEARIEYISANKAALKLLEKWAPTALLTVASHALEDPNLSFHGVSWGDFKRMVDSTRAMICCAEGVSRRLRFPVP